MSFSLFLLFSEYYEKIKKYLKHSDWYIWVNMNKGQITMPIFQSLEAFWPGLQVFVTHYFLQSILE